MIELVVSDRARVAVHEAGHFVAGSVAGHLLQDHVSIVADCDGSLGRVVAEELTRYEDESLNAPRKIIEGHVVSLFAGYAAQRKFDPNQPDADALAGASRDFHLAELWGDVVSRMEGIDRAAALVEQHWGEVKVLSRALLLKESLGAEAAEIVMLLASSVDEEWDESAMALVGMFGWTADDLFKVTGVTVVVDSGTETS